MDEGVCGPFSLYDADYRGEGIMALRQKTKGGSYVQARGSCLMGCGLTVQSSPRPKSDTCKLFGTVCSPASGVRPAASGKRQLLGCLNIVCLRGADRALFMLSRRSSPNLVRLQVIPGKPSSEQQMKGSNGWCWSLIFMIIAVKTIRIAIQN